MRSSVENYPYEVCYVGYVGYNRYIRYFKRPLRRLARRGVCARAERLLCTSKATIPRHDRFGREHWENCQVK